MKEFTVTLGPLGGNGFRQPDRRSRWTLTVTVPAKSKNDARTQALRKTRTYLADRSVRIIRVREG